jgi:hypothetical protein
MSLQDSSESQDADMFFMRNYFPTNAITITDWSYHGQGIISYLNFKTADRQDFSPSTTLRVSAKTTIFEVRAGTGVA